MFNSYDLKTTGGVNKFVNELNPYYYLFAIKLKRLNNEKITKPFQPRKLILFEFNNTGNVKNVNLCD